MAYGHFMWHCWRGCDADRIALGYARIFGWTLDAWAESETRFRRLGRPVAGVVLAKEVPRWLSYVPVAELDRALAAVAASGGEVLSSPAFVPGVGRVATVRDPCDAQLGLYQPDVPAGNAAARTTFGHIGWNELLVSSLPEQAAFYQAVLGWRFEMIGPNYAKVFLDQGLVAGAALPGTGCPRVSSAWLPYVCVRDVTAALATVDDAMMTVAQAPFAPDVDSQAAAICDSAGVVTGLFSRRVS